MSDADDPPEIRYIDTGQFIEDGYLQEVNRQFLHPLGLALELTPEGLDDERYGSDVAAAIDLLVAAGYMVTRCWDYRDDPEGIVFADSTLARPETRRKAENVLKECIARREDRVSLVGQWVQRVLPADYPSEEAPGAAGPDPRPAGCECPFLAATEFSPAEIGYRGYCPVHGTEAAADKEHVIVYTGGPNAVNENQAVCTCGWKGTPSTIGSDAVAEAAAHLAENNSEEFES